ncbi:4-aminobutyrate--2-oxoglutarate transaminase [Citricoccus sp. SGAir0253]|uniref:4-aminobutyrate--2-oxoglutarate transaminase n=1 Tax=Citricoccus sp. SGAir0253 TaxID=2567881 RepID=UPI001FED92D0|nr:4-aminobutyrate--2-oxoglutarate transaminase [Citricoccus sp. SGAir0253]
MRTAVPGPRSAALAARRSAAVADGVSSVHPFFAADADGGILLDVDGNAFVDLGSGIAVTAVGASHPDVVAAVAGQAGRFTHTCAMVSPYEGYVRVCEELAVRTPGRFAKRAALFTSGAEAVENAVKVARVATGRSAVVALEHAFHGRTNLTLALTGRAAPYKASGGRSFGPFASEVYRVPGSYPYREQAPGLTGEQAAERAIRLVEEQVGAQAVAAVVVEPVLGEGGVIVPAPGFLPALARWARAAGIVLVADEVQTGLCRTGDWFAAEHEGIEPDLVAVGKGLAGGLPLSAVVGRAELMDAIDPGGLGGTFGGNPVACAAALATLAAMDRHGLCARARRIEELALPRLRALAARTGAVGEVRGRGAMLGMEFVVPDGGRAPDARIVRQVLAGCRDEGVALLSCGTHGNVLRLVPPLVIGEELLSDALDVLEAVVSAAAGGPPAASPR